jgi:hypothetical protein
MLLVVTRDAEFVEGLIPFSRSMEFAVSALENLLIREKSPALRKQAGKD